MSVGKKRLLAVDPGLTSTGWALFSFSKRSAELEAVGNIRPPGPSLPLESRIEALQKQISQLFLELGLGELDLLVCEDAAPLVKNPNSAAKVERVRGTFETLARAAGLCVPGRVNPRTIQSEIMGLRGAQLPRAQVKEVAAKTVLNLFPVFSSSDELNQDAIDAILVGSYSCGLIERELPFLMSEGLEFAPALHQLFSKGRGKGFRSSGGKKERNSWASLVEKRAANKS